MGLRSRIHSARFVAQAFMPVRDLALLHDETLEIPLYAPAGEHVVKG